ncbi:MAG: hypothetical protein JKX79_01085 [Labilibaculum sp.]|nr:hypothetical protein [Labilibaculum sp.]
MRLFIFLFVFLAVNATGQKLLIENRMAKENSFNEFNLRGLNRVKDQESSFLNGSQNKSRIDKIMDRMYFDFVFQVKSIERVNNTSVQYSPKPELLFTSTKGNNDKQICSYGMNMGYKLGSAFSINSVFYESIGNNFSIANHIGLSYQIPISAKSNKLVLIGSVAHFISADGYHIGNFSSKSTFKAGGKKFKADKIALYVGKKKQGVSFDFGLRTKLYKFYSLFVSGGYQLDLCERDRLFIREKSGFFLTRKKIDISLKNSAIQYFENGVQTSKNSFDTDDFYLKAGIRFSL